MGSSKKSSKKTKSSACSDYSTEYGYSEYDESSKQQDSDSSTPSNEGVELGSDIGSDLSPRTRAAIAAALSDNNNSANNAPPPVFDGRSSQSSDFMETAASTVPKDRAWYVNRQLWLVVGGILFFLTALILVTTIPNGFMYVEWNEYVLKRGMHPHNAGVKLNRVYTNGRYWVGTGFTKVSFLRTLIGFEYREGSPDGTILAFTDSGLEFSVECSFQVRIIPSQIPQLYRRFPTSYRGRIAALGLRALKNVAVGFSLTQYIRDREIIQNTMFEALRTEIASLCGDVPCVEIPSRFHFQLRRPIVPEQIRSTWLNAAIQNQVNLKQQNEQVRVLVVKETERLEAAITANITLVNTSAAAEADRIRTSAIASADRVRESARSAAFRIREQAKGSGVQAILTALNMTDPVSKDELLRLLTVMDTSDVSVQDLYRRSSVFADPENRIALTLYES